MILDKSFLINLVFLYPWGNLFFVVFVVRKSRKQLKTQTVCSKGERSLLSQCENFTLTLIQPGKKMPHRCEIA